VARRKLILAALSCALALALPALTLALPRSTNKYLLGPRMIRSEIALKSGDGTLHDFRLDRGRLLKRWSRGGLLPLAERDGTKATIKVASSARVILNGKFANLRQLRAGMQVAIPRDRDRPADVVYASTKSAPTIPYGTVAYLLGGRMFRAEIALMSADGVLHDYLLDRGRIKQVGPYTLTLKEADRTIVTIAVAATARVRLNGKNASFAQLRKGMIATTMRDGDNPADQVFATGR
jgi:hypothetical protein